MSFFSKFCLLAILSCGLISCGGTNEQPTCNGQPVPIFDNIQGFEQHTFEVTGQNGKEFVSVPTLALDIELYQSGCTNLEQEYRFLLHGTLPTNTTPKECAITIAQIFYNMSQLDPKLSQYAEWAKAVGQSAENFQYNETILLDGSNIQAKILKQQQTKSTILTVVFNS